MYPPKWRLVLPQHQRFLSTTFRTGSPATNRRRFALTTSMRRSAVWGPAPAVWGVIITFSMPQSGWSAGSGSVSNTSSPAPAISPASSAEVKAARSTTTPREILMRYACFFHLAELIGVNHLKGFGSVGHTTDDEIGFREEIV